MKILNNSRLQFMFKRNQWAGTTGKLFEREFVCEFQCSWDGAYVPFRPAMDMVRQNQPENAVHEEGLKLLAALARELGVDESELKLFTSSGGNNPLDCFHKVDAFIDLKKDGRVVETFLLDFKMNRHSQNRRAFIVRPSDVEEGFLSIAATIANGFRLNCRIAADRMAGNFAAAH